MCVHSVDPVHPPLCPSSSLSNDSSEPDTTMASNPSTPIRNIQTDRESYRVHRNKSRWKERMEDKEKKWENPSRTPFLFSLLLDWFVPCVLSFSSLLGLTRSQETDHEKQVMVKAPYFSKFQPPQSITRATDESATFLRRHAVSTFHFLSFAPMQQSKNWESIAYKSLIIVVPNVTVCCNIHVV